MLKLTVTVAFITALSLSAGPAQSAQSAPATQLLHAQRPPAVPIKDPKRNAKLADAASIAEDLIGFALDGKAEKVAERVTAMRKTLATLRPLFAESDFATLEGRVAAMEQASAKGDTRGTALAAVEAYRIIENATDAGRGPVPLEVAMLDYAGFKLSILAAAPSADWAAIAATAKEADGFWATLAKKIGEASIRNLVGAIQDGLKGAVERKDIYGVKFAAKMQLEVVDVLEGYFKGVYRRPAR